VLTAGAMITTILVWSRYGLLANGPWEWDESNFARGLVDFDLAAHFPHPPGFPGWIAIGKVVRWFVPEPLTALQVASATASLVTVVLLVMIARRLVPVPVATAAAVLVAFLPGVWLHAVRGFASTTATTFGLAAAVVLLGGSSPARLTSAAVLVTAAALVRPQLAPVAALVWLGGAFAARRVRDLIPGVVVAVAMVAVSAVVMAHASGGWNALEAAFVDHGGRHMSRLAWNRPTVVDLGFVKGLGGLAPAILAAVLTALGVAEWSRVRGRREAMVVTAILAALVVELVFLHNRTYTRYAVPLLVAMGAPMAAGALRLMRSPRAAASLLAGCSAIAFGATLPLVWEQHRDRLPGFAAIEAAHTIAERNGLGVVEEASLHPLVSYHWYARRDLTGRDAPPLELSPWAPEPWVGVDGHYLVVTDHPDHYLGPLVAGAARWTGPSRRLEPFTQQRMLDAAVLADPPLPVGEWWPLESTADGETFMWGGVNCGLELPPLPATTGLVIELLPAPGPAPLDLTVDDRPVLTIPGDAGVVAVRVPAESTPAGRPFRVVFSRRQAWTPGDGDNRPLAVQIRSVRAVGPRIPWSGPLASDRDRGRLAVTLTGVWPRERFGDHGAAAWLHPEAELRLAAGAGTVTLRAWSPRPTPANARAVLADGRVVPLDLAASPTDVHIPVAASDVSHGEVVIRLVSDGFVPADAGAGQDRRELGFVVSELAFAPPGVSPRPAWWAGGELDVAEAQLPPTP